MLAREARPVTYNATGARLRPFPGARGWDTTNPWIYMGSIAGVKRARQRRGCLICPNDIDPLAFEWPVSGIYGVLVLTDADKRDRAARLLQALIRDGAEMVACVSEDGLCTFHCSAHRSGLQPEGIES